MGICQVGRKATAGLLGSDTTASYSAFDYIAIGYKVNLLLLHLQEQ